MALPLVQRGEIGKGRNRLNNVNSIGGNDPDYLTARIARDCLDMLERMKAREFKSVQAAARAAGPVTPTSSSALVGCLVDV